MVSSAQLWILNKIVDLTNRCGITPLSAEFLLLCKSDGNGDGHPFYELSCFEGGWANHDEEKKCEKLYSLLGLDEVLTRRFDTLGDAARAVDHALSLMPRPRAR